jgi:gluconate kinase
VFQGIDELHRGRAVHEKARAQSLTADDQLDLLDLCARYYVSTDEADVDGFMACSAIRGFEDDHVHRGRLPESAARPSPSVWDEHSMCVRGHGGTGT